MRICLATDYGAPWAQNFWGDWIDGRQVGGSERIFLELARECAALGHAVTLRVPFRGHDRWGGCRVIHDDDPAETFDVLFAFDLLAPRDHAKHRVLVWNRSDPAGRGDYDEAIVLSKTHGKHVGLLRAVPIGGGVRLGNYRPPDPPRTPHRVIYTSSPDRGGHHAEVIGRGYDFVATYRGIREYDRNELVRLQRTAWCHIHPCDPTRPSEFFSMSVLESLAAGTPVVISDADALPELWSEAAYAVLPRPIRYPEWHNILERLEGDPKGWWAASSRGRLLAAQYDWPAVAARYLEVAGLK